MSELVAGHATVEVAPSFKGFVSESSKEATRAGNAAAVGFNKSMSAGVEQPGKFKAMGSAMASHVGGAFKIGMGAAGAAGAGLVGTALTKGFQRLTAIDDAKAKLTGLGNSASSVDAIMKNAMASVKGTAFGMGEAATTAAGATAAGVKPGKDLERTLKLTADAATIAGTDMSTMGSIFNKVATSNKIQGDVIAQLSDAGIPVVQMLSKELGVSAEQVVDLASKGKINFAQFQNAMEQGLGGAAASSGKTFSGAMKNFKASLGRVGANLMGGIFPKLAPGLTQITKAMEPLEAKAKLVGNALGEWVSKGVAKLPGMVEQVKFFTNAMRNAWVSGAPNTKVGIMGKLESAVAWVSNNVPKVKAYFADMWGAMKAPGDANGAGGIAGVLSKIGGAVKSFASNFKPEQITNIFSSLGSLAPVANAGLQIFGSVLGTVADHADLVAKALPFLVAGWAAHRAMMQASVAVGKQSIAGFWAQTTATTLNAVAVLANRSALRQSAIAQYAASAGVSANTAATELNTAAQNQGIFAQIRARAANVASRVAMLASAAASRTMAAGQWLLNAAMNANPISLIVIALVALGAAFVVAWNKSETFRNIVTGAWDAIKGAALGVWNWMRDSLWPGIQGVWNSLANGFVAVKDSIVRTWNGITAKFTEAWNWVSGVFKAWWGGVVTVISWPIDSAKGWIVKHWDGITGKFTAVKNWVFGAFKSGWNGVVTLISWPIDSAKGWVIRHWDGITAKFTAVKNWVFGAFKSGWNGVVRLISWPVDSAKGWITKHWDGITAKFTAVKNWVFGAFKSGWNGVVTLLSWPIDSAKGRIVRHWDGITGKFTSVKNWVFGGFKLAWDGLKTLITDPVQAGKNMLDNILGKDDKSGIRGLFSKAVSAIGGIWDKLKAIVTKPIQGVLDVAVNPFIRGFNKLGKNFNLSFEEIKLADGGHVPGRADGGTIPGPWRGPRADNVLGISDKGVPTARVNPGEYITRVASTQRMERKHPGALEYINRFGTLPGHADGGLVGRADGGKAPGMGPSWQWQWEQVRKAFPQAIMTSNYRPGATTHGSGNTQMSYHAIGRAIDVDGPGDTKTQVAKWINAHYAGISHDLLYSGLWGNRGLYMGKWLNQPATTVADHYNHVHWGLEQASILAGGAWKNIKSAGSNATGLVANYFTGPLKSIAYKAIDSVAGRFGGGDFTKKIVAGMAKKVVDGALSWGDSKASDAGGGGDPTGAGSKAAAAWRPQIEEALRLNGITPTEAMVQKWITQIGWESSGNPNAVQGNIGDINNKTGDLAKGLVQVIGSTFRAYHVDGTSNNVFDPVANLAAGINYAKHRYGPGMGYIGRGPKHGYADGGKVAPLATRRVSHYAHGGRARPGLAVVGEYGPELVQMRGSERVTTHEKVGRVGGGDINLYGIRYDSAPEVARELTYEMRRLDMAGRYAGGA